MDGRWSVCLAVPGRVISVEEDRGAGLRPGKVDFGGVVKQVSLALTPEAGVGDYVLVHAGFAISVVDEQEAQRIFNELEALETAFDEGSGEISRRIP